MTAALYVSTPICINAVSDIQKAFAFAGDAPPLSPPAFSTITLTGRNGTPVHATAQVQDGEYITSDEWEVYLKQTDDGGPQDALSAFQGDLEVRIGGILLASFNDDDSQFTIAGGSSTFTSSSGSVGISFSESGMLLRIVGEHGLRKILTTTSPKSNNKASSINSVDKGPKKQL